MKHSKIKLIMTLCLLVLGFGNAGAQRIYFGYNEAKGYQTTSNHQYAYYSQLGSYSSSDWGNQKSGTNSWNINDWLSSSSREVIRRHNTSTNAGDMFDWFTLSYYTKSYSKIKYTLTYQIKTELGANGSTCRASYFDYGTAAFRWTPRNLTSSGYDHFRTAYMSSTGEGEHSYCIRSNQGSSTTTGTIEATIDNSDGSEEIVTKRYGGLSCSKVKSSSSFAHYVNLYMSYVESASYFKHITFNENGGKGIMTQQKVENSASIKANTFTREGFTFTGWNTKADGTGDSYADGATISATSSDKGPVTLYAQWTPQTITATFDYTYRTSESAGVETYQHMSNDDAAFTTKVRATLHDHNNAVLAQYVLTAPAATTPQETPTEEFATHKTAALTLDIAKGESESLTNNGSSYTITLNADNYDKYSSVDFEVLNASATASAPHWAIDEKSATEYIFKYEGQTSANMFEMTWRVNLKNLSMYPSDIFVKPMRNTSTSFEQIPAMQNMRGIECKLAGYLDENGNKVTIETYNSKTAVEKAAFNKDGGAYYEGEYNVLKTDAQASAYSYKLGLTGFIIDGNSYDLAAHSGDVPEDMISTNEASGESSNIVFDRLPKDIPVLILSPNVDNNESLPEGQRATIDGNTNYLLYVDNGTNKDTDGNRIVNLEQFEAKRPHYDFTGWKDAYSSSTYNYNDNYHFNIGTQATTTLLAQWERSTAPDVSFNSVEEEGDNFIYKVTVTDDLNDIQGVEYIYTDGETEPDAKATGWASMTGTGSEDIYTVTIPMLNDKRGQHLWVKASNEDKTSIIKLGEVRSIYKLTANPNPDSHTTSEIDNGTWSDPEEGHDPVFTPDGTKTTIHYYDYYSTSSSAIVRSKPATLLHTRQRLVKTSSN